MTTLTVEFLKKTAIKPEFLIFGCFAGVFLTMPMGTSPPLILGALGTALWIFSGRVFRVKAFLKQSWFWPVLVFIALPWIGLLYTPDPYGFGMDYARKTYYWLFALALASLSFKNLQPRWLMNAFLLGLALNACVGLLQLVGLIAPKQGWFSGLARGYNTLTMYLVLAILACAFYFRETGEARKRAGLAGLMILFFFHLIILESRTGYITLIVLSPILVKTLFKKLDLWKIGLAFLLILGAMYFSPIVQKRVDLTISQMKYHRTAEPNRAWGREYTVHQDRLYMWRGAMDIFLDNPILGVGTGGYPVVMKGLRESSDPVIAHPHNNILHMAASYGMIGMVAFFWLFGEILRNGWRQRETLIGYLLLCSGLVLFINGLFNTTILDVGTLLLLSLTVGLQRALPEFSHASQLDRPVSA